MPAKPRSTDTITFSLPPEMALELRQVVKEEGRTVSELLREAIRLYMEEKEWLRLLRYERLKERESQPEEGSHQEPRTSRDTPEGCRD